MYGVGNLTHTTYANQRMTLSVKIAKISMSKRNTMTALRGQKEYNNSVLRMNY